jgi:hypothetical protein
MGRREKIKAELTNPGATAKRIWGVSHLKSTKEVSMNRSHYLLLGLTVLFFTCVLGVNNGHSQQNYASERYGINAVVPPGWKVINRDDEEVPGDFKPVFEMKRKSPVDGKNPLVKLEAYKAAIPDIEKFGRDFISNLQKAGFTITKQQLSTIGGKPAFESKGEMRVGQIVVVNSWVFMAGKEYLFMITLTDADIPALENEIYQLLESIQYK